MKHACIVIVALVMTFCGGGETDESLKVEKKMEKVPLSEITNRKSAANILKITGIKFDPVIDVENDIYATPVLSDPGQIKEFYFRWFVNDREISGENNPSLSREYFIEGDWIYCLASIQEEGVDYPEFKSSMVRVKGPVPQVNLTMVKQFDLPGVFRYKINAEMPGMNESEPDYSEDEEQAQSKSVSFELLSPLEKGIELDTRTGEIVWDITRELIDELGDTITIKFSIISPDGRRINSSVSLTLTGDGDQGSESKSNSPMGSEIE